MAAVVSAITLPNGSKSVIVVTYDRLSTLNQVGMDMSIIKAKIKHVDLISIIRALWETSKFETVE